jgi:hypothetical protein
MKIRSGFVSNSSSSSFIVSLKDISASDLKKIFDYSDNKSTELPICRDGWSFSVEGDVLHGFTIMDNDDLDKYLKEQNISTEKFQWEHD